MLGSRVEGAMTPDPTVSSQPLLFFQAQAPTPPDRYSQIETPMEAWNSSVETSMKD